VHALLAGEVDVFVAGRLERLAGELVIQTFDLLQAQDTSGFSRFRKAITRSIRRRTELMFQVARERRFTGTFGECDWRWWGASGIVVLRQSGAPPPQIKEKRPSGERF
jgi:hypothetical protein